MFTKMNGRVKLGKWDSWVSETLTTFVASSDT